MKDEHDLRLFILNHPQILRVLKIVEALSLPDCWVGGGFIRNATWDSLHEYSFRSLHQDIDIIFFDKNLHNENYCIFLDKYLSQNFPGENWSVKNQFLMQRDFNLLGYTCSEDAMRYWPETCTAIAARVKGNSIELLLPYGVEDLLNLTVRPTPYFKDNPEIILRRAKSKNWRKHWPNLIFYT